MATLTTSNGLLYFKQHLLYLGDRTIKFDVLLENLRVISEIFDKIDINWGPAFGSLIGVIRNSGVLPWAPVFNLYILKEDEERFKESLNMLFDRGFRLMRHERRGLYYLERNAEYFKIFILHKISSDLRHTGGSDFIHERYLQNTVKWDFHGIRLNVPADVDDYLTFQYGDWVIPQKRNFSLPIIKRYIHWVNNWIQDHLPDNIYYEWLRRHRKKDLVRFKELCISKGTPMPENVQLSNLKPRRYRRILTVGVYDLLHKGHVELYRRARGLGDYLIVAVQDSDYILKYKPDSKVLNSTDDRMYMVRSVRYVDEVIVYYDVDEIVKKADFDVFVTGPDQSHAGFKRAIEWCEANGKEHIILGRTQGVSSSELKQRISTKTMSKNKA